INLSPSFFNRLKLINHSMFDKFREAILKKEPAILSKHDMPITLKMHGIINSIINCDRVGIFKRMYMESQVISLLLLQIEQFCDIHKNTSSKPVSKKNMDKMYMVKEMLETNFKKSDTLVDIAKKVGTNEFTLKTCFKELFGVSVFQYWKGLRLEAAKSMLLEEGLSVQEVSRKIGYKNPQHFTTAFKKQFGVVPSRLRN
ncbi:MAG: AraC family transcriptional regulator, partial [Bacteroidota bacterium]